VGATSAGKPSKDVTKALHCVRASPPEATPHRITFDYITGIAERSYERRDFFLGVEALRAFGRVGFWTAIFFGFELRLVFAGAFFLGAVFRFAATRLGGFGPLFLFEPGLATFVAGGFPSPPRRATIQSKAA
jgi:hypothetical protein